MLRGTRGLLLLAIVVIVGAVAVTYYSQRQWQERQSPERPQSLPLNTDVSAQSWTWRKDEGARSTVVSAKHFRRLNGPDVVEIEGVEVQIIKHDTKEYDDIRSEKARFDEAKGTMYSDGDVQITLRLPTEGPPHGRMLQIRSSGVTYESKTGKAYTDRPASFTFDKGDGKSIGASYDPTNQEIVMKSQVELHWRGNGENGKPMDIEAGEVIYRQKESNVLLRPWSRLTRGAAVLEGGEALVTLKDGVIEKVEARQPRGTDREPGRNLEYSAENLLMEMSADGEVDRILAEPNARIVSTTETGRTTTTARRVDMAFDTSSGASELKQAYATGNAAVESVPLPRKGAPPAETRKLASEAIMLKMLPGGRELDRVETVAPGRLEFLPNQPGQRHRTLDAYRMLIKYGPRNMIQSFSAADAATRTDPEPPAPPKPGQKPAKPGSPILTWSKDLKADFDPKTGQLARMEQWTNFRYEEGTRRARANGAILEEGRNLITLEQNARIWDESGVTSADRILLDQKSGNVWADGKVVSSRVPDRGESSAMLSNDQPLEARASRMTTSQRNTKIHYEGEAAVWQGANRIWADAIDIDRTARVLVARGHVRTQFLDQQKSPAKPLADGAGVIEVAQPARATTVVTISASDLVYTEADRVAHYTGGVHLVRPGLDLEAAEVRAWLNDSKADSSLDRAFADGKVSILRSEPGRTVTGASEHAEYYATDQRIFLAGGEPTLIDSARGVTKGRELTYFAKLDKLLVNGITQEPAKTRIIRRH